MSTSKSNKNYGQLFDVMEQIQAEEEIKFIYQRAIQRNQDPKQAIQNYAKTKNQKIAAQEFWDNLPPIGEIQ